MSEKPEQPETPSSKGPPGTATPAPAPRRKPADKPVRSGGGGFMATLALLLALVALAFAGWQWWQGKHAARQAAGRLDHKVAELEKHVAAAREALRDGQAKAQHSLQTAREALDRRVDGLSDRFGNLEDAVATLTRHRRHGREAALLDQAAMLLRLGQQRYELFGDADGAIKAYVQAGKILDTANDPELDGVLRTLRAERKALQASYPDTREATLATLAGLRDAVATLPLKTDRKADEPAPRPGFWQRVWHGLATAVVVRREDTSDVSRAGAQLTRQLVELDLAQAQAAYLAWDAAAGHAALQRVATRLARDFDAGDADVRKARADVAALLKQPTGGAAPRLGEALHALGNLRGVRDAAGAGEAAGSEGEPTDSAAETLHPATAGSAAQPAEASS